MRTQRTLKMMAVAAVLAGLTLAATAQKHPRELGPAPELNFTLVRPATFTLANGVHCFYLEDRELPLVSLTALVKGGSLHEPAAKAGVASLFGTVLRTGGTRKLTGDQINEELEFLAASIESSTGPEYTSIRAGSLKKDFGKLVELIADLIMNPEFRQDKLDLARNQALEGMRRRWDQPMQVAMLLFNEKLYGADSPYGRRATPASLQAVTREDLLAFHRSYFASGNLTIGITGDVSLAEARTALEKAFKTWPKKTVTFPDIPALAERADGTVYYAAKDTPQGNVVLGHLGIAAMSPDEFKVAVMNDILGGGGFTARLMKELRSNRGLTYGIYGGVSEGIGRERGAFRIASQLKAAQFLEALDLIKGIVRDLQANPVSDEEITTAKNSLVNSFVFRFEQKGQILGQFMQLKLRGYPDNYLDTYIENIRKVTKADVQEAAGKYMDPEKMIVVVVGDEKRFDRPLSSFGQIKEIDLKALQETEKAK